MRRRHGAWPGVSAVVLITAVVAVVAGCGSTGGKDPGERLLGSNLDQARRLYAQLQREHSLEQDRHPLALVHSLLDHYPDFSRNDEVLTLGIDSAKRLDDVDEALSLTDELLVIFPDSPLVDPNLLQGAEMALGAGDTLRACGFLIRYDERNPRPGADPVQPPRGASLLDTLDADALKTLMSRHAGSSLWPYLGYDRTRALLLQGTFPAAEEQVVTLEAAAPESSWTLEARRLLSVPMSQVRRPRVGQVGEVRNESLGVLAPLTGRYAVLGNALVDAALFAVEAANEETGRTFVLQVEDTAGDPVVAALAARRLCGEGGSVALLGAMLSSTTTAAAIVADQYGAPLVSPTATNDRVWELGEGVFQTNLTSVYEIRLLAELLVPVLLKERFAILRPDTPEGQRQAEVFRSEVESLGGEVVVEATFPARSTDFREAIFTVRRARPEVIFVPMSVDQMALVGPQLDFHRCGSLVVGLSGFNNPRLLERAGTVLEGLVFPDDLALFPASWTAEFNEVWKSDDHPGEATTLALKSYQTTRMVLDTIHASGAEGRGQLTSALTRRLASRDVDAHGPDAFARTVRIVRGGEITFFPAGEFTESWEMVEGALADSLAVGWSDTTAIPLTD